VSVYDILGLVDKLSLGYLGGGRGALDSFRSGYTFTNYIAVLVLHMDRLCMERSTNTPLQVSLFLVFARPLAALVECRDYTTRIGTAQRPVLGSPSLNGCC
jgi:hypothetical protein